MKLRMRAMSFSRSRKLALTSVIDEDRPGSGRKDEPAPRGNAGAAGEGNTCKTTGLGGLRRSMSFGRAPKRGRTSLATKADLHERLSTTIPYANADDLGVTKPADIVSAPGSDKRLREIEALLMGVGGGHASNWLRRAEEAIVARNLDEEEVDSKMLLEERLFVRLPFWPYYRPKHVSRNEDHIVIEGIGQGTIISAFPVKEYNYEIKLVIESEGTNMVIDVRCLKRVHYNNLATKAPRNPATLPKGNRV
eukprot:scaffold95872_cov28-Tisochrysis_lutea.AAC.2